jgi:uncharacterized protein YtpQ (UPF0354 family)
MEKAGVGVDELHRIGLANLAAVANQIGIQVQPYGNIFAVLMGGNFEASLILLDVLWDQAFRQMVSGDYAAAFPARDILSFCDRNSELGIEELRQLLQRADGKMDHPLSQRLYFRSEGKWAPEVH